MHNRALTKAAAIVACATLVSVAVAIPVAVDDSYSTNEDVVLTPTGASAPLVTGDFEPAGTDVAAGTWSYLDKITNQLSASPLTYPTDDNDLDWNATNFSTSSSTVSPWGTGTMGAGAGIQGGGVDGITSAAVLTGMTGGANGQYLVTTYLFRRNFTLTAQEAAVPNWVISTLVDDGCVIYINGQEVDRVNMAESDLHNPDGTTDPLDTNTATTVTSSETAPTTHNLNLAGKLVAGNNCVAVEVHQVWNGSTLFTSSDAGLNLSLVPGDPQDGFAAVEDCFFGTTRANFEAETYESAGGYSSTGGLRVQMGSVFGGGSRAVSAGWRRTFTLATPATVTLSFRHRMLSGQDYDSGEYQEIIADIDGTQLGTPRAPSAHNSVALQVGDGNGGGNKDTGWQQASFDVALAAGTHTLTLGGYANEGSAGFGGANEQFEAWFDDIVVSVPSVGGGILDNDTGGVAPVTAVKDSDPVHGSLVLNADGTFTYTPTANYFGPDSFTYHANDSTGDSGVATVNITVNSVNDLPSAVADGPYPGTEDTPLTIPAAQGLLVNDTDVESSPLTAALGVQSTNGSAVVNADGSFTFTPAANFSGTTTFSYRANDGTGNSANAVVTLTIAAAADDPVAVADTYSAVKNTPLVITATTPGSFTEDVIPQSAAGWHYFNSIILANRNLGTAWRTPAYVENADWLIGAAELGYGDGDEATVIEDNPTAGYGAADADRFATSYFRREFTVTDYHLVTGVQLDVLYDDSGVYFINGTEVARTNNLPTAATLPELGWDYFVSGNFNDNLTASFPLPVSSILSGTNLMAGEIHQNASNSSDVSFNLRLRLTKQTPASILANDTDPDPGSTLTVDSYTQPAHGTVSINPNGTFTYTPANGYVGADSFTYVVIDETGRTASGIVNISVVTGPNAAPVAAADFYPAVEDQVLNIELDESVLVNDTDAEGDPMTAELATPPAKGTLQFNTDGSFTYTPNANANGVDTFTYKAFDGKYSAPVTVTLTIQGVNDAPAAVADTYFADPGQTLNIAAPGVLGNDTDIDTATANLTAILVSPATGGTLTLNADGSFSYVAPAVGGNYTFTYLVNDGAADSPTAATVTIQVNGAPTAAADSYSVVEDNTLTVNSPGVLANDSDPENQSLTAVLVAAPANGSLTLNANGSFSFIPASNFAGVTSFSYKVSDGVRESSPATVTITVSNVNDAPVASNNSYVVEMDTSLSVAAPGVLGNDSDADVGATLTATLVTDVTHGVLSFAVNGAFTYTPAIGYLGSDSFSYKLNDGTLESNVATVTITVAPPTRNIRINEIMFHPTPSYPEPLTDEWLELRNVDGFPADISGWQLTSGVSFTFPPGTVIPSQGYLVVCANLAAFQAKYPAVTNVVGSWIGTLANGGEKIALDDAAGNGVDSVTYATEGDWGERYRETTFGGWDWRSGADGGGKSLELRNSALDNDNGQNWGDSVAAGGTPGVANSLAVTEVAPLISKVNHTPAVPTSTDNVVISCELKDEKDAPYLSATLRWRDATGNSPGAYISQPMTGDGTGDFFATLTPKANLTIIEFYISATDGALTRTWPAPTSEGQNANCQYQVDNEAPVATETYYRMILTGAENSAFNGVNQNSDRQFNQTLVVSRGSQADIRYRSAMRIRGNSSRSYQFKPLRINVPGDDPLDGQTKWNFNPRAPHLQYVGQRLLQAVGLAASDSSPAELRRNGVESTTSSGSTPDYGKWVRMEAEGSEFVKNHWPEADGGNIYKKVDGGSQTNHYWRSSGWTLPTNPDGNIDGWSKSNNSSANDWSDLTHFFSVWQAAAAPHFPGASATNVAQSTGGRLTGNGAWNGTAFTAEEFTALSEVTDFDYWAKWFAAMTIIQDIETNLSNGVDDDYSAYFIPGADGHKRMLPVAHDLDTIFGLGDTQVSATDRGLYDMTDNSQVFRTLLPLFGTNSTAGYAAFRTTYHDAIRSFYGGFLNADTTGNPNPPFYAFVDAHLTGWAPAATISSIKTFATARQAYLLGLIGSAAISPPAATANAAVDTPHGNLMIHEILADNVTAHEVAGLFPDIIELHNAGALTIDLSGMSITDNVDQPAKHVFPSGSSIPPGGYLVLYADGGAGTNHLSFSLNNTGETIALFDSAGNGGGLLDSITFGLQLSDRSIGRTGPTLSTWTLCNPTPSAANSAVSSLGSPAGLKINEWLGNTDYKVSTDFVEIYNPAITPVAVGGMALTDDIRSYPTRFVIPQLSFVGAGSFTRLDGLGESASTGNASEITFKFGATFGNLYLTGANGTLVDVVDVISQPPDTSNGRSGDGAATVVGFAAPAAMPTPGLTNAAPPANILALLNNLRITEFHYNPNGGNAFEFIELQNIGPSSLELAGVRFTQGVDFTFPAYTLPAGAYVLVVKDQAAFEARWGAGKPIAGLYGGSLDNSGETLALMLPQPYDLYIHRYAFKDSWEASTDGQGDSLQIVLPTAYAGDWDEKFSWQAGMPTPGVGTPFQVNAGLDQVIIAPASAIIDASVFPGGAAPSTVSLAWTKVSGPGNVTFTSTIDVDTNALFTSPGTYVLRLTATGPGPTTAVDDVTVSVFQDYDAWIAGYYLGITDQAVIGPVADPDRDGVQNILEYALGMNPASSDAPLLPTVALVGDHLLLTYHRVPVPGITFAVEASDDLLTWSTTPVVQSLLSTTDGVELWQAQDMEIFANHPHRYLRVKVTAE